MARILLWLILLISPISASALQAENRPVYPGGRYVAAGGGQLFLDCYGKGSPTVLLWSGQGGGFIDWLLVQPELSKTNRVCSFDPAGFGRSATVANGETFAASVDLLDIGLRNAHENGPFVIVGQSNGWYRSPSLSAQAS